MNRKKRSTTRGPRENFGLRADRVITTLDQFVRRDLRMPLTGLPLDAACFVRECQATATLKKYKYLDDGADLRELAFAKFRSINSHMQNLEALNSPPLTLAHTNLSVYHRQLLRARATAHEILYELDIDTFFAFCKHSGGVSQGIKYSDCSMERKFQYPISTTRLARPLLDAYFCYDTMCDNAVQHLNRMDLHGPKYELVKASRATTVPKTNKIDRMIAIEPTANMFLQQGLMEYMYSLMKSFGLDVSRLPDKHKLLAKKGSIDGSLATIDFSSASDCLSIDLVRFLLPTKWFNLLNQVRCSTMTLNEESVELSMFSTMGNATTFPLESIVFYCLASASLHTHDRKHSASLLCPVYVKNDVSVFGDDCIVPTRSADSFMNLATRVGFIVNSEKSHYRADDGFRESCGGDYLHGTDVRPFCIKRPTSNTEQAFIAWLYNALNQVLEKYISYFGPLKYVYNRHAIAYLFRVIRRYREYPFLVPDDFPSDAGLQLSLDNRRISACYSVNFNRITKDEHGTVFFNFLNFRFKQKSRQDDFIRLASDLKVRYASERSLGERSLFNPIRRIGGYVVARTSSGHWPVEV